MLASQLLLAPSATPSGENKCVNEEVDCGGICQYAKKNAECKPDQKKFVCKKGFAECGKDCAEFFLNSFCDKDKFVCPPDKPLCGPVCRAKLEGAECDKALGWVCPKGTIGCGPKCQEAIVNGICQDKKIVCPLEMAECGKVCSKKPEGSKCNVEKKAWECEKGFQVCGKKCVKTVEGAQCTEKGLECKKPEKECASKCQKKPRGSFCCRKKKKFVCKQGFKDCNNCCKRFIVDAECKKEGWRCPAGKSECGGKCVSGPQGGMCNAAKQEIRCPQGMLECKKKCIKFCPGNCGECRKRCNAKKSETCNVAIGKCVCTPNNERCDGPTKPCVNLMSTNKHCGKCGNACQGEQVCSGGKCTVPEAYSLGDEKEGTT